MLWLCLHLPHLAVELRQPPDTEPTAIFEREGNRRRVLTANALARAAGIRCGLDVTLAQGRQPQLQLLERAPVQERRALMALGAWAHQWSSDICVDATRWLLALEVGASLALFGGLDALLTQLLESGRTLGYTLRTGVAPTHEGAALIACSGRSAAPTTRSALRAELARRPLQDLQIPPGLRQSLNDAGLLSIGEVLQLPAAALARRFGPEFPDYLQRLLGERPDPRPRFRMTERYRRLLECAYPVDNTQALLFPLRRMLTELQGWLRGRDGAVDGLRLTLRHRDLPATVIDTRLGAPERDAAVFTPLLRERLERTALPAPVTHLVLETARPVPPAVVQHSLFDTHTARDAQWTQLLDRLRARLGETAVRELRLLDDHRPERAWTTHTGAGESAAARREVASTEQLPARPLWIMEPRPLRALPKLLGHPERIESGWWDGGDARRDYYIAETAEGALWWVDRDLSSTTWFLHGIWA